MRQKMRIKSQYILSIIDLRYRFGNYFCVSSFTNQQVTQINNEAKQLANIQTGASNLAYISNDYFLYQQSAQLPEWQNQFSSLSDDLSKLTANSSGQQAQINTVNSDLQNLDAVFNSSVSFLESAPS